MSDQKNKRQASSHAGMRPGGGGSGRGALFGQKVRAKDTKGTLVRLWKLTEGARKGLVFVFVFSALTSITTIAAPYIIGESIDSIRKTGDLRLNLLMILLAIYIGDWLITFLQELLMATISQRIINHIRTALFAKIKKLPLSFFDKYRHGETMSRLTNDIDNISTTLSGSLSQLLTHTFSIIGIFVMMLIISWQLTLISLSGVALLLLWTRFITKRTRKIFSARQKALGRLNGHVEESMSGLEIIKAFGVQEKVTAEFEEANEELTSVATKAMIWSGFLMPMTNVINNFAFVGISVTSAFLATKDLLGVGMISTFLLYLRRFTRPFVQIASIYNNFQSAVAGAERVFEIFDEDPEPEDVPGALYVDQPEGRIEFENVDFSYVEGKPVLQNFSMKIEPGTKIAIVGPTGAGKTTIINLLTRFYDVDSGRILLDGHDLRDYRMTCLRKGFGAVLQDTLLFSQTVRENICFGRNGISFEEVVEAAKISGAHSFIKRLPEGYDTVLVQGGAQLSQGQRQLIAIARAILLRAPIMILDEATSSVDTVTEQKIREAMLEITKGRTSFIIAHRLTTIRDSDVIILVEKGQIAEQGSHGELMALDGKYALMYKTQMGEI